jgi:hypothetical protein
VAGLIDSRKSGGKTAVGSFIEFFWTEKYILSAAAQKPVCATDRCPVLGVAALGRTRGDVRF